MTLLMIISSYVNYNTSEFIIWKNCFLSTSYFKDKAAFLQILGKAKLFFFTTKSSIYVFQNVRLFIS